MKYILTYTLFFIVSIFSFAQSPQAINYQGVARDNNGHPLINQNVGIKLSILDGSNTGATIYSETHNLTTNATGLFNLNIGTGTVVSGTFATIPWGQGDKWLQIEMDAAGGNNYLLVGTTQFLSVPYALHAQTANSLIPASNNPPSFTMISNPSSNNLNYWDAMNYCFNLVEGGYTDWRLPTLDEIQNYIEIHGLPTLITWTKTYNFQSIFDPQFQANSSFFFVQLNPVFLQSYSQVVKSGSGFIPIQCVR